MTLSNLISLSLPSLLTLGITSFPALAVSRDCQVIGRILSSSKPELVGRAICAGEAPLIAQSTVLCTATGQIQQIQGGSRLESQGCLVEIPSERLCNGDVCRRPKGGQQSALVMTNPAGTAAFSSPISLSWEPFATAQQYFVQVEGERVRWGRFTSRVILPYPPDQPRLQPGQTYRISIVAFDSQGNPLSSSTRALNILSQTDTQSIQNTVTQLQQLKIDPDELAAIDLKAIYLANGLVGEAIKVLELRVAAGSQNARIYQALGQCYARAKNAPKATNAYQRAIALAKLNGQIEAQKRLQQELNQLLIAWNSEPTP